MRLSGLSPHSFCRLLPPPGPTLPYSLESTLKSILLPSSPVSPAPGKGSLAMPSHGQEKGMAVEEGESVAMDWAEGRPGAAREAAAACAWGDLAARLSAG